MMSSHMSHTFSVHTGKNGPTMEDLLAPAENNIIIATDGPQGKQNVDQTGDVDYATRIAQKLTQMLPDTAVYYPGANTAQFVLNKFNDTRTNKVFHLMLNPPWTGCGIAPGFLADLKTKGFKIIVTAIEFAMYQDPKLKEKMFEYFPHADKIIFLDERDLLEAKMFAISHSESLKKQLDEHSHVIAVPPTIDPQYIKTEKSANNIISFGMIRTSKGFDHTLRLAQLIKDDANSRQEIYIVGSVQKAAMRDNENLYDPTLYELLCGLYPDHKESFKDKSPEKLMTMYNELKLTVQAALPVKLLLDVSEPELTKLFRECEYAFYAADRGATLRNSSVSTCLAYGCVLYSHVGDITPAGLRQGGSYADAMVLASDNNISTYAKFVFEDMKLRERNKTDRGLFAGKSMNQHTREAAGNLSRFELSLEGVVNKHMELYAVKKYEFRRTMSATGLSNSP